MATGKLLQLASALRRCAGRGGRTGSGRAAGGRGDAGESAVRRLVGASALPPLETTPAWGGPGVHGIPRGRRWDAVVLAPAAGPAGCDRLRFVVLADGVVSAEEGPAAGLEELIAAASAQLSPPYRAEAVLREPGLWAIAANGLAVVELPPETPGSHIVLSVRGGQRLLRIDDLPAFLPLPAVEALAAGLGADFVVQAQRLTGAAWEARAEPL